MRNSIAYFGKTDSEEAYKKYAQMADIVLFLDPSGDEIREKTQYGIPVFPADSVAGDRPDTVVVSMKEDFTAAKEHLLQAGFSESRIFEESHYFRYNSCLLQMEAIVKDCRMCGYASLLDVGLSFAKQNVFSLSDAFPVYGCLKQEQDAEALLPVFDNLYGSVFATLQEAPVRIRREALFLGPLHERQSVEESLEYIVSLALQCRAVYLTVPYPDTNESKKWYVLKNMQSLRVSEYPAGASRFFRIEAVVLPASCEVYVAVHKEAHLPKSPTYVPLWVGKEEDNTEGYITDKDEPSIAYLNPRINECTGIYHIWKHATSDIVGLVHYRRYFFSARKDAPESTLLEAEEIRECLASHDIIVPKLNAFALPLSVQITTGLDRNACERGAAVFEELIGERQPDYLDAYRKVMSGHCFYPLNMMITKKEIFDAYCEWLFSFLTDAAKRLDFDHLDGNSRRIAGFYAERMLTVWLTGQNLRIKEMPVGKII